MNVIKRLSDTGRGAEDPKVGLNLRSTSLGSRGGARYTHQSLTSSEVNATLEMCTNCREFMRMWWEGPPRRLFLDPCKRPACFPELGV